jgi:hypothetical protein
VQNPKTADTAWGTYQLIVTEKRNGCKDTAVKTVSINDFTVLLSGDLELTGNCEGHSIILRWNDLDQSLVGSYDVEKYAVNKGFTIVGTLSNSGSTGIPNTMPFSFTDHNPTSGYNTYRIKATGKTGQVWYSGIVTVTANGAGTPGFYLITNNSGKATTLVANADSEGQAVIAIYNLLGQVLQKRSVKLNSGVNRIDLPAEKRQQPGMQILCLFIDGQVVYTQKMVL